MKAGRLEAGGCRRAREREHILEVLRRVNGSRKQAIALLGISERALRYKLKQYREEGFLT